MMITLPGLAAEALGIRGHSGFESLGGSGALVEGHEDRVEAQAAGVAQHGPRGMRERAMLIGGEITLQGRPGKGTTVTVRVPLVRKTE